MTYQIMFKPPREQWVNTQIYRHLEKNDRLDKIEGSVVNYDISNTFVLDSI